MADKSTKLEPTAPKQTPATPPKADTSPFTKPVMEALTGGGAPMTRRPRSR
jgi:hypothetical protein